MGTVSVPALLLVCAGAFFGGLTRFTLNRLLRGRPATFTANTLACLVAGILLGVQLPELYRMLLIAGFCGALSTWSTLARELGSLVREGRGWASISYLAATVVAGTAAVWLGLQF